jgi:hypothetical protein
LLGRLLALSLRLLRGIVVDLVQLLLVLLLIRLH